MRHLLFLHLLGASVWVGGHLVLLFGVLPKALRQRDPQPVRNFEQIYERIGIPALLIQIVTGLWMASLWLPHAQWFGTTPAAQLIQAKLVLLGLTAALGVHARLALIPKLDAQRLPQLGAHIVLITLTAVAFVWVGAGFRFGGLF
ncbi:CopD family protein [Stutzerimonas stutzeri]|uniref:CopD family protein n=1 Tax=Stutzerimonas stutzeri TaxID=316 RepID=UPI001BCCFB23|nr:CopD family protein [Stutzerimonas stutzeri]